MTVGQRHGPCYTPALTATSACASSPRKRIREGRLPLLLTKTAVEEGVDETNYEEWLAAQGETA